MRETRAQLGFAAQAGCADHRAFGQFFQPFVAVGHQRVKRVGALAHRHQNKAFRQIHRHIFKRMHCQIGAVFLQCGFQLFDKQAFAADFGQGFVQNLVALRGHAQNIDRAAWIQRLQFCLNVFGLPHGQCAFAAGNGEFLRNVHGVSCGISNGAAKSSLHAGGESAGCFFGVKLNEWRLLFRLNLHVDAIQNFLRAGIEQIGQRIIVQMRKEKFQAGV